VTRRKFVCGNWKMHKTVAEAVALVNALREGLGASTGSGQAAGVQVAVAPPFTALQAVAGAIAGSNLELAAQNVHFEPQGAYTGEVSAPMLAEVGCRHGIVGHSERRQFFGETDESVRRKVGALLAAGVRPIVCVGELLAEREAGQTLAVVDRQVRGALAGLAADQIGLLTLAYEPVWAIGTGKTATTAQAQEVHAAIRGILRELAGTVADQVRIQYGGSVKPDNAAELMSQPDVDGALVGGASLKAQDFIAIVKGALR
jgi:triosephosphate isomerase (TIM)